MGPLSRSRYPRSSASFFLISAPLSLGFHRSPGPSCNSKGKTKSLLHHVHIEVEMQTGNSGGRGFLRCWSSCIHEDVQMGRIVLSHPSPRLFLSANAGRIFVSKTLLNYGMHRKSDVRKSTNKIYEQLGTCVGCDRNRI